MSAHDHQHRKHSLPRRIRHALKMNRWLLPVLLLAAAILAVGIWAVISRDSTRSVTSGNPVNVGAGYREISYQGKQYRYNSRISAVLLAGVDADGDLASSPYYTEAPRADSISLIVMDEYHHRTTVIALNRNTVAAIRKYTLSGRDRGMFNDLLCYAYTYGDGGKVSCESLCEAVSGMLYGIPVKEYVVTSRASLPILGGILGPVQVTVPNDDLASIDPAYTKGAQVTVDGDNLEFFVRTRDTGIAFSNIGRMDRQRAYITAAMDRATMLLTTDAAGTWQKVQQAEKCMLTNVTRSRYLDLVKAFNNSSTQPMDYYIPEGESVMAGETSRFYADEEALLSRVIDIFFIAK